MSSRGRYIIAYPPLLFGAWIVAWIINVALRERGFFLKRLELNGRSFWSANVLTTLLFVAMHVPGWLFKGRFPSMASLAQAMIPPAVLSLLFGWTKKRSQSLYGAIVVHTINNLYSAIFP
jgi:membrane protease YdiL (CAAX protease family)